MFGSLAKPRDPVVTHSTYVRYPLLQRRYDPASLADQEREIYEDEKMKEQIAIKTTPYRSQTVVSPKPKTKHDHVLGSYLYMQHYPDAPTHGSPIPPAPIHHVDPYSQATFNSYVNQVEPRVIGSENLQVKMPYNSPIGLYSKENAMLTLNQTNPMAVQQGVRIIPIQQQEKDNLANLANSPTWQMIQTMEHPQPRQQQNLQQQITRQQEQQYRQVTTELLHPTHETGRTTPLQSMSFNVGQLL